MFESDSPDQQMPEPLWRKTVSGKKIHIKCSFRVEKTDTGATPDGDNFITYCKDSIPDLS